MRGRHRCCFVAGWQADALNAMTRGSKASSPPCFEDTLLAGYAKDEWFKLKKNTDALRCASGLWFKGEALLVPDHDELRSELTQQLHATPWAWTSWEAKDA